MSDLISKLSEIRSRYNCFAEDEEPYYRALSEAIMILSQHADGDTINRQAAIKAVGVNTWAGSRLKALPSAQPKTCEYWESESNFCALHRPSAQPDTARRIVGKSRDGMTLWYQCDMCNEPVDEQDNFCRGCGRRLIDE